MEYKQTLNLPETTFPMKANLAQAEPERLARWDAASLYRSIRDAGRGRPLFHLHDGPPYANGHIHIGHAVNKILKDIVCKYYYKEGYDTPYIPGWDCHGLPIELQAEKDLGKEKKSRDTLSVRRYCRSYAGKFLDIQRDEFRRLGVLGDWERPYVTMAFDYQANIVRQLAEVARTGALFRGKKPVYWCTSCVTALAEAEVEYADHTSLSAYVRFPVTAASAAAVPALAGRDVSVVIWTTTPWTLPANRAVAVHPEFEYVLARCGSHLVIVARELLLSFGKAAGADCEELARFTGEQLAGLRCRPPFADIEVPVLTAGFVTLDTGSGCVHIAPGHGQEDYELGIRNGVEVYAPVDGNGMFSKEVPFFAGKNVFKVNAEIIDKLGELGLLMGSSPISHSYPHCWRCKKPIVFRAEEQWFVSMEKTALRTAALQAIDTVRWVPSWGRDRIHGMISNRPDWCISRQRAWGVPIVAFFCKDCGDVVLDPELMHKVADLFQDKGADLWFEQDASFFLGEGFRCPKCGNAHFDKEEDILDVWFDSGTSFSYLKARDGYALPVDMYLEGSDQHRGWFHSSLLVGSAVNGEAPYRQVLTHGFVVDADGRKMSKSVGNVISPQEVIRDYGAEILRIWVASEDYREDIRISKEIVSRLVDGYRKVRNTFRYMLGVLGDFDVSRDAVPVSGMSALDRVMLHRLRDLVSRVRKAYAQYDFHTVYHSVYNFCIVDLSALYLDILKDRLYVMAKDDRRRRASQTVVHEVARQLALLLAPVFSFTCDEVWEHFPLPGKQRSIHLETFPELPDCCEDPDLAGRFETLLALREEVQKALEDARRRKTIGHALDSKVVIVADDGIRQAIEPFWPELREIMIVSQIELLHEGKGYYRGESLPVTIDVSRADGAKCERCWVYDVTVGTHDDHRGLCTRCRDVVTHASA